MRDRSDVALSTQTFSFFQGLTEAVATMRYAMLVVTLPSSYLADLGEQQKASLARLNKVFFPLSNLADGRLTFTLELDLTSEEGIPARTLEQTIKETVRQIGARVVEEAAA